MENMVKINKEEIVRWKQSEEKILWTKIKKDI